MATVNLRSANTKVLDRGNDHYALRRKEFTVDLQEVEDETGETMSNADVIQLEDISEQIIIGGGCEVITAAAAATSYTIDFGATTANADGILDAADMTSTGYITSGGADGDLTTNAAIQITSTADVLAIVLNITGAVTTNPKIRLWYWYMPTDAHDNT